MQVLIEEDHRVQEYFFVTCTYYFTFELVKLKRSNRICKQKYQGMELWITLICGIVSRIPLNKNVCIFNDMDALFTDNPFHFWVSTTRIGTALPIDSWKGFPHCSKQVYCDNKCCKCRLFYRMMSPYQIHQKMFFLFRRCCTERTKHIHHVNIVEEGDIDCLWWYIWQGLKQLSFIGFGCLKITKSWKASMNNESQVSVDKISSQQE